MPLSKISSSGRMPRSRIASAKRTMVAGSLTLDGTLDVDFAGGFSASAGQSFDVLDWGTLNGAFFTLDLPALDPGLNWDTSQLYTNGTLAVVPEPNAALLLAACLPVLARLRRASPQ